MGGGSSTSDARSTGFIIWLDIREGIGEIMTKAKTDFVKILEEIHASTDLRYGQILYNAIFIDGYNAPAGIRIVKDPNPEMPFTGFDTFYVEDETLTEVLKRFQKAIQK